MPVPQAIYGFQLQKVTAKEADLIKDPKELEVRKVYAERAAALGEKLKDPKAALAADKEAATKKVADLKAANGAPEDIKKAESALAAYPKTEADAKAAWGKVYVFAASTMQEAAARGRAFG